MKKVKIEKQKWGPFLKLYTKVKIPWIFYISAIAIQFIMTSVNLTLPALTGDIMAGKIFDRKIVIEFVGLTLFVAVVQQLQRLLNIFGDNKTQRNARSMMWSKIIRLPLTYYNKEKPSGLISRITTDSAALNGPLDGLSDVINGVYGIGGSVVIMYGMNRKLTLYTIAVLPFILLITWIVSRMQYGMNKRVQMANSSMTGFINERLGSVKLIKSFASEDKEINGGYKTVKNYYHVGVFNAFVGGVQTVLGGLINLALCLIVILIGAKMTYSHGISLSNLVSFYMYVNNMILPSAFALIQYVVALKGTQGTAAKISEIFSKDDEQMKREVSFNIPDDDIVFKNVSFSYGNKKILSDLNFTIPKGKTTAIVGPNGAGKTTIFNLIERFYKPQQGEILFGNVPVEKIHLDEWRRAFGYVSQNSPLLSGTIRENITYGVDHNISDEEIVKAAKLANAYDFIEKFPEKFDAEVGEIGGKLSGGQRQRIAIARAIIKNPDYLLLDEATCSLDAYSDKLVEDALQNLMKGRTTIVIAHNMRTVKDSDQIIVIDNGEVKGAGQHKDLYESNEIYHKFVELQNVC